MVRGFGVFNLYLHYYVFVLILNAVVKEILEYINSNIKFYLAHSLQTLRFFLLVTLGLLSITTWTFKFDQPIGILKAVDSLFIPGESDSNP